MTVEKISVSLDSEAAERTRRAAKREGVSLSAWLSRVAAQAAEESEQMAAANAAWDEYVKTHGDFDEEAKRRSADRLAAADVGEPETPEHAAMRLAVLARLRGEVPPEPSSVRRAG